MMPRRLTAPTGAYFPTLSTLRDDLIPVTRSIGSAVPVTGLVRVPLRVDDIVGVNNNIAQMLVVSNTGDLGTIMLKFTQTRVGLGNTAATYALPLLSKTPELGGPTSARPMKAGVTLINTTASLNRGGVVYVLNTDQRVLVPTTMESLNDSQATNFFDTIRGHPDTVAYSADHFSEAKEFHCHVVDNTSYESFEAFLGAGSSNFFQNHLLSVPGNTKSARPMSTLFIIFDATNFAQDYMASARASFYTRWPLDTLGGQVAREIPVASVLTVEQILAKAKADAAAGGGKR
jgi:hypothetical protein